jgi:hypothetical protein
MHDSKTLGYGQSQRPSGSWWSRTSRRTKIIISAVLAAVILALGLGLGLGLAQRGGKDLDSEEPQSTNLPTGNGTGLGGEVWQPAVKSTWQIILIRPLNLNASSTSVIPDVDVFDIDLFDNPKDTFDALRRLGKKSICYFSAGSYEPSRPDSRDFQSSDYGSELDGWPGERWLNIKSSNVRNIMSKRIELAAEKGCDAIDPDNMDAYVN